MIESPRRWGWQTTWDKKGSPAQDPEVPRAGLNIAAASFWGSFCLCYFDSTGRVVAEAGPIEKFTGTQHKTALGSVHKEPVETRNVGERNSFRSNDSPIGPYLTKLKGHEGSQVE